MAGTYFASRAHPQVGDPVSWYYKRRDMRYSHSVYGRIIKVMAQKVRIRFYDWWHNQMVERNVYPHNLTRATEEDVGQYEKFNALTSAGRMSE